MGWTRWAALGLLAWLALSVPVGILVGKVIKGYQDREDQPDPPEEDPLDHLARLEFLATWEALGFPVKEGKPVHRGHRAPRAIRDR